MKAGNTSMPAEVQENSYDDECETLKRILHGCQKNNQSCQEKLYKKFYGYAFAIALKYCLNREEAMEIVNDSFIKVFKNMHQFQLATEFRPWFRRIIVNTAIDHLRANKKHRYQMDIEEAACMEAPVSVVSKLDAEQVLELLTELPETHRFVFNLYELDGYSHQEIGQMLQIPESSSRTYLARAKAKLRRLYKDNYQE